jgi:hypothetical protein
VIKQFQLLSSKLILIVIYTETISEIFKFLMLVTSIVTTILIIRVKNKTTLEFLLLFTLSMSIIDISSNIILIDFMKKESIFIAFASIHQYIFYLFEIITIIYFYHTLISKKKYWLKTVSIIITSLILSILFYLLLKLNLDFIPFTIIIVFELIFINFSFGYFFNLSIEKSFLTKKPNLNSINNGFFIFVNLTSPFYFITLLLEKQNMESYNLDFINHIGYIILHLSIITYYKWRN